VAGRDGETDPLGWLLLISDSAEPSASAHISPRSGCVGCGPPPPSDPPRATAISLSYAHHLRAERAAQISGLTPPTRASAGVQNGTYTVVAEGEAISKRQLMVWIRKPRVRLKSRSLRDATASLRSSAVAAMSASGRRIPVSPRTHPAHSAMALSTTPSRSGPSS
jgi:hypothetical protein